MKANFSVEKPKDMGELFNQMAVSMLVDLKMISQNLIFFFTVCLIYKKCKDATHLKSRRC